MDNDADPAIHWLTRRKYERDAAGRSISKPRMITTEVSDTRTELAAERPVLAFETDEVPIMTELRALATASVLEECAARLRLAARSGDPLGSEEIADIADELANYLYHRTVLRS